MKYDFSFYKKNDFDEIEELILNSYTWGYPSWGLSRHEFSAGLHPDFCDLDRVWERTAGVYRKNGKIAACIINEGNGDGYAFFIFDSKERAEDTVLLEEMLFFSKTTMSAIQENQITRYINLPIPKMHKTLINLAESSGFVATEQKNRINILPFNQKQFEVRLPEGYSFADGEVTPDFYLSNTHMMSFNYGISNVKKSEQAFHNLRKMKHYNKKLDLCILDNRKRPVAMAIIWCDEKMRYCELEPLGVVWWERRKGLATALLHEASNRVMKLYPNCKGMYGGDQPFYEKTGFLTKEEIPVYEWKMDIYPSWDEKSADKNYSISVR